VAVVKAAKAWGTPELGMSDVAGTKFLLAAQGYEPTDRMARMVHRRRYIDEARRVERVRGCRIRMIPSGLGISTPGGLFTLREPSGENPVEKADFERVAIRKILRLATPAQREIVRLMLTGADRREILDSLAITGNTLDRQVHNLRVRVRTLLGGSV
jgi:hypothetical protein